jgi:hypothetical protein
MKTLFLTFIFCAANAWCIGQNIGINLNGVAPTHQLTVGADALGYGIVQSAGRSTLALKTDLALGHVFTTLSDDDLNLSADGKGLVNHLEIKTSGNVGLHLGDQQPLYKFDVKGRWRLRYDESASETAGIWLEGPGQSNRAFVGSVNNSHTGFLGNAGANWMLAMSDDNSNTGIGTSAPTASLDVNGNIRIRSNTPTTGSILVSSDVNGNVTWQDPVAFRANGTVDGSATSVPPNAWTKIEFSNTTEYNLGFHYQPAASRFVAPVTGVYHFTGQASFVNRRTWAGIGLGGSRNGAALALPYQYFQNGTITRSSSGVVYPAYNANVMNMSVDVKLQAGDIIWMVVYRTDSNDQVSADGTKTWFTGRLITVL